MKTKGLIAMVILAVGSVAAGCSGGQTTSDGVPDTTATGEPTSAPTVTAEPTSAPTTTPTTVPTTPPTTAPTTQPTTSPTTQPTAPPSGSTAPASGPPDAARGEKLFMESKCDTCHGTKKKPGRIPLFTIKWDDKEKQKALQIMKKGKGEMPKLEGKMTEAQMADLLEFASTK